MRSPGSSTQGCSTTAPIWCRGCRGPMPSCATWRARRWRATRASPGSSGRAGNTRGLNCNVFEAVWGHGGEVLREGRISLDTAAAREALGWLRDAISSGLSPRSVISSAEEETRRAFQDGRAVFLRNWPYVWAEVQAPGSPVRGKVAFAPLPSSTGSPGPGALGGWQLAVGARLPPARRRAAERLVAFLTSHEAAVETCSGREGSARGRCSRGLLRLGDRLELREALREVVPDHLVHVHEPGERLPHELVLAHHRPGGLGPAVLRGELEPGRVGRRERVA